MVAVKISSIPKDEILEEVWRYKDALSARYKNSLSKYSKDARIRQKSCGHRLVNLSKPGNR